MHQSVLLHEAVDALALKAEGVYADGTFGRGGHSKEILKLLGSEGRLYVFDKDPEAIKVAEAMAEQDGRVRVNHISFSEMKQVFESEGLLGKVDGVLLDLGLSSPQLDVGERGFSFMNKGPLDMRMNNVAGRSAAEWINVVDEEDLAWVIKTYGEERFSKRIARAIIKAREEGEIQDTKTFADIVSKAIPKWEKHKHPATRTFQAVRIFINQELDDLGGLLDQILEVLNAGGRLVVISFHSLEDRIVKQWMRKMAKGDDVPSYIPVKGADMNVRIRIIGKVIKADEQELANNPRARSAIMRVAEKL